MKLESWLRFLLLILGSLSNALGAFVGINIGTDLSDLPSPEQVVAILQSHQITHVRLFDADSHFLSALSDTGIEVTIGVTNDELVGIGKSPSEAASWVNKHVAAFLPAANITAIAVGSEVLSSIPKFASFLVPAMNYLHKALVASNLNDRIKVSTPMSISIVPQPFPPSAAGFNDSWNSTLFGVLRFLKNSNSFFMLNAFPYEGYVRSNGVFPIEYALFQPLPAVKQIVDPNTLFRYESMLDAMVDATYNSILAYNVSVVPITVTETGWPWWAGEQDATVENAEAFNNNLIRRVLTGSGPPSQPGIPMNSYIYEMFNEDKRTGPGPVMDKRYGLFFGNGSSVYSVDLGGPTMNSTGGFCVARKGAGAASLQDGLSWACGPGQANCSAIQLGRPCYMPNTIQNHASYAYNDYYQRKHNVGGTCDFGGTAVMTMIDPSYGSCTFTGSLNSSIGGVGPPAFGPMGPTGSGLPCHQVPDVEYMILATILVLVSVDVHII